MSIKHAFDGSSQRTPRRFELHRICHASPAGNTFEVVIMQEGLESTSHHAVLEIRRAIKDANFACVPEFKTKMAALPGNFLPESNETGGYTGNSALTCPVRGGGMQVDTARKIEASFDGRYDQRDHLDANHYAQHRGIAKMTTSLLQSRAFLRDQLPDLLHEVRSLHVLGFLFATSTDVHLFRLGLFVSDD
jgi:hypothetical protein